MTALRAWAAIGAFALAIGCGFYLFELALDAWQARADARRFVEQRLRGERP